MSNKAKKFGLGLLVGAVAGVVTGLLTAPKSGKETRADIKRKAGEVTTEAVKRGKQVADAAMEVADDVKGKAADVAGDARDKAEELRKRTENAVEGARTGFNKDLNKR